MQYARLSRVTLSTIALDAVGIILTDPCTTSTTYQLKKVKHKLSVTLSPYCQLHFSKPDLQSTCSSKHTDITNPETNHLWRTALLKANIPLFSTSTLQQFTPNQLGLVPSAWVSLSKGCYCGQEIIARCYHLGQAKRTLHTLFSTQSCYLAPGTRLRDLQKNITLTVLAAISSEQGTWLQLVGPTYFQCKPQAILHTPCGTALPTVTC